MDRRNFLGIVSAAAWPPLARAQQTRIRRIGALLLGNADAESFRMEVREGLRKSGYVEGKNVSFDFDQRRESSTCFPSWPWSWPRSR
jgi:putative ABC transport system substrate-binding protein